MAGPSVNLPFGNETLLRGLFPLQIDASVLGDVEEGPSLVVVGVLDVQLALLLDRLVVRLLLGPLLHLGQVLLEVAGVLLGGLGRPRLVLKAAPGTEVALDVAGVLVDVALPLVLGPHLGILEDGEAALRGLRVDVLAHDDLLRALGGLGAGHVDGGVLGEAVAVEGLPLQLELEVVQVGRLDVPRHGVLGSLLLLGLERVGRADLGGIEVLVLGVVLDLLDRGVQVPAVVHLLVGLHGRRGVGHDELEKGNFSSLIFYIIFYP